MSHKTAYWYPVLPRYNNPSHTIPTGRLKDKKFCFGILGRFRGNSNSKNYNKKDSKAHKFWKVLKTILD